MRAGFTSGPWKHVPWQVAEGEDEVRAPEGWLICCTSSGANARLIAAAPDGYEAAGAFIEAAINEWDIPERCEDDEGWLCDTLGHALADAFLKAKAFRAKARGEQ